MASLAIEPQRAPWPTWYTPPRPQFELCRVINGVAASLNITSSEMVGRARTRDYVLGRAVVAQILHERGWSSPMIGRVLGGRDHSTILNLLSRIEIYLRYPGVQQAYLRHRCPKPGRLV